MGATIWWFVWMSIGEEKWAAGVAFINQAHVRYMSYDFWTA